jgi:outer membrane autotransporter protein
LGVRVSRQSHRAQLRAALLASSALIAAPAAAQDATWNATPGSADFNTATNWTPAAVPTGIASFGGSTITSLTFSGSRNIDDFQFNGGAPAYTFTLAGFGVQFNGNGIVNNSANAPTFTLGTAGAVNFINAADAGNAKISNFNLVAANLNFSNNSTAGTATITSNGGGLIVTFADNSSAANSTIVVTGIIGNPNTTQFLDTSTAGNAHITTSGTSSDGAVTFGLIGGTDTANAGTATIVNNDLGTTNFLAHTSALNANITNNSGGVTNVQDQSTLANATIINNAGGFLQFGVPLFGTDTATAGNATITNNGTTTFAASTTAGSATITTNNGGNVSFFDSSTGGAARFITNAGGTFDMSGLTAAGMTAGSIEGAGSYILGSKELTVGGNNMSTEVSGVISGIGGKLTKLGTGTLILSGLNTYTGGTFNCACSTLQLGTLARVGAIVGEVTNEGIFNVINANTSGITSIINDGGTTQFFNGTSASAAIIVNKNNGALNFFNTSTAGTADITNRDGGITTFSNSSTAGNATITNRVTGGETSFLNSSNAGHAIIVNNGGLTTFIDQSSAANADITNRNGGATIFGSPGGTDTATAGNATITNRETGGETIFQALTTAGSATIKNNGGQTSFFEMSNAGFASIDNRNGGQTVFGDQSSAADATIVNRDGFFFAPSQTVFFGDSTAGNASITNQSFGVTLFVDNATAGNATITNNADGVTVFGTPQFTDTPSAGTAKITSNDGGQALFQAFSTAGSAIITTNSGGVTAFFDNSTGGNAQFITNAGGTVDFSQTLGPGGDKKITAGSIAGAGDYFLGGIELTVGGNNLSTTVSGTINDGLSPFTCGCGVPGSGASLVKVGTGTLTIAGINNTYTGPTTVNDGTLVVNGSIVSSSGLTVNTGGTVGGTGNLPTTTINGGNLSPGNSIGTISVNGSLSFVGPGNYIVEVAPAAADKTNVTGAPGTASLGGTLTAVGLGGIYTIGTKYTVLNATGGVSGTFSGLTISGSFGATKPHIEYDANNVYLVLDPNAISPFLVGATPNQRAVAGAVDAAIVSGSQNAPFLALFNLTTAQLPGALDQLSGEVHASTAGALLDESLYPRSAVLGRLRQASYGGNTQMASLSAGGPQVFSAGEELSALAYGKSPIVTKAPRMVSQPGYDVVFWAQGFGARGKFDSDGNATIVRRDLAGFFSGVDTRVGTSGRVGIAAGYTGSKNALDGRGSSTVETGHLMGYGGWSFGALNLRAGGAHAWHSIDTSRTIAFPGFFDTATARYNGSTGQIFGELGYGFTFGNVAVEPFAGAAWVHLRTDAALERGGAAALNVAANKFEVGYSTLGIRAASMIPIGHDMVLVPRASLAWQHAFNDVTPEARLAFIAVPVPFVIAGAPIARDSILSEAGLDLAIGRHATLGVSYVGQLARNVQDHAAKGKFAWKF